MQLQLFKLLGMILIFICTSACSSLESTQHNKIQVDRPSGIVCPEPRRKMCTREFRPVCATRDGKEKTYGNGCSACADPKVVSYRDGACDQKWGNTKELNVK